MTKKLIEEGSINRLASKKQVLEKLEKINDQLQIFINLLNQYSFFAKKRQHLLIDKD